MDVAQIMCVTGRPKRPRGVLDTGPAWLSGYLDGNGVVDALAAGAMTGIDAINKTFSVIGYLTPISGGATYWASTRSAATAMRMFTYIKAGGNWPFQPRMAGSWGGTNAGECFVPAGLNPAIAAVCVTVCRTAGSAYIYGQIVTSSMSSDVFAPMPNESAAFSSDLVLGSLNGTAMLVGRMWGLVVIQAEPTVTELRSSLSLPPWQVWSPSVLMRAYNPAGAYTAGGDYIPDLAESHGGPATAVPALLRNGSVGSVVVP